MQFPSNWNNRPSSSVLQFFKQGSDMYIEEKHSLRKRTSIYNNIQKLWETKNVNTFFKIRELWNSVVRLKIITP